MQRTSRSGSGFDRVDHDGCLAVGADAFHQFQGELGVAVEVDDDDVVALFEQPGHIVEAGGVGGILPDFGSIAEQQGRGGLFPAQVVGANQRDRQRS